MRIRIEGLSIAGETGNRSLKSLLHRKLLFTSSLRLNKNKLGTKIKTERS